MAAKRTSKPITAAPKSKTGKRPRKSPEDKERLYNAVEAARQEGGKLQDVFDAFADEWGMKPVNVSQIYRTYAKKIESGGKVSSGRVIEASNVSTGPFNIDSIPFRQLTEEQLKKLHNRIKSEVARRQEAIASLAKEIA